MAQLAHQFGHSLLAPHYLFRHAGKVAARTASFWDTFTRTRHWVHYHEIKQDVLLKVAGIIPRHGTEIACPARIAYLDPGAGLAGGEA